MSNVKFPGPLINSHKKNLMPQQSTMSLYVEFPLPHISCALVINFNIAIITRGKSVTSQIRFLLPCGNIFDRPNWRPILKENRSYMQLMRGQLPGNLATVNLFFKRVYGN